MNLRPIDPKSNALPVVHCATFAYLLKDSDHFIVSLNACLHAFSCSANYDATVVTVVPWCKEGPVKRLAEQGNMVATCVCGGVVVWVWVCLVTGVDGLRWRCCHLLLAH